MNKGTILLGDSKQEKISPVVSKNCDIVSERIPPHLAGSLGKVSGNRGSTGPSV